MKQRAIILSAALLAATLAATAAPAQNTHAQQNAAPGATQRETAPRATTGSAPHESFARPTPALRLHGIIACAPASDPGLACDRLEPLLAK